MMIRVQKDSGEMAYQPLVFDPDLDAWLPLSEETYATPMEAVEACQEVLCKSWEAIVLSARKLRALTEHPAFHELEADGISGELIRDEARTLTLLMERRWTDFVHLLDEPADTDLVLLRREQRELLRQEQREQDSGSQEPSQMLKHAVQDLIGSLANFRSSARKTWTDAQTLLERLQEGEEAQEQEQARETEQAIDQASSGKEGDE